MHLVFVGAIIASVFAVLGVFQPASWIWALSLLWVFLFGILNYDNSSDRVSILNGLKRRDNALVYTKLVDSMLGGLRRMLSPADAVSDPKPDKGWFSNIEWYWTPRAQNPGELKKLQDNTFSWPVMDAALKVAVIYPLLLLLIQWGISGTDTGIAGSTILEAEETIWLRAAIVCPIVLSVGTRILAAASQIHLYETVSALLILVTLTVTSAFAVADTLTVASAFAFASAFAVASAVASAFAIAFAFALAFAFAGPVAFAGPAAFSSPVAFAVAIAVAVAGAVAIASASAVSYGCAKGKGGHSFLFFVLGSWIFFVAVFTFSTDTLDPERRVVVFAIGLLPLINAVFDYLSYGITLWLIRFGRSQRNYLTGLIWIFDAVAAVVLLIGLGIGLTATIALINVLAGQDFIAIRPILDDLSTSEGRSENMWLTFTLLSTLVPTLVHLVLVFLSAFTWVPQKFKLWIARGIENNETGDLTTLASSTFAATLGALWAGIVAAGLWAIWLFLTIYIEPAGLVILRAVETVALFFGWVEPSSAAAVEPGVSI